MKTGTVKNSSKIELKAASNCWICEGWSEFIFDFQPPMQKDGSFHPDVTEVKLHASCDDYKGEVLAFD